MLILSNDPLIAIEVNTYSITLSNESKSDINPPRVTCEKKYEELSAIKRREQFYRLIKPFYFSFVAQLYLVN